MAGRQALSVAHGRTPNDAIEKTPGRIVILDNAAPVRLLVESVAESLDTPRASNSIKARRATSEPPSYCRKTQGGATPDRTELYGTCLLYTSPSPRDS